MDNYGVVTFDHLHFSLGIVIGVVSDCMLATLGTTNQKIGVFSDKKDRAVETEGISQSVRVLALLEFSQEKSSSTSSDSSTARMTGHTFLMPQGSVYWESFSPCMECGYDQPPTFFEDRLPQSVERK